jgi:hypothetical protein
MAEMGTETAVSERGRPQASRLGFLPLLWQAVKPLSVRVPRAVQTSRNSRLRAADVRHHGRGSVAHPYGGSIHE